MKHHLIALACCVALAACAKNEAPKDTGSEPGAPATAAAEVPAPADNGLPAECESYIARFKACMTKAGGDGMAAQFQQALDQSKAQWEATADKASLIPACKAANDQFAQTAAILKCE